MIEKIKIVLADDHVMFMQGIKMLLSSDEEIEVVGEATNGEDITRLVKVLPELDVLILDINMPKLDGIEVTRKVKEKHPEIRILILTTYNKREFIMNVMKVGADGYILKNSGRVELLKAIKAVFRGEPYYSDKVTSVMLKQYQRNKIFDSPFDIDLSEREKEVIALIAHAKSTVEIADELNLSEHTVNSHRKKILQKLRVKNVAGIVRYALQTGIIKGFDL